MGHEQCIKHMNSVFSVNNNLFFLFFSFFFFLVQFSVFSKISDIQMHQEAFAKISKRILQVVTG